ncbi:MAG: glycerate kinase [Acidobacteria bacterium]|nr:glycerate kinase [Acidobacteriota bacterium]
MASPKLKILVAPSSFKESMTSTTASQAIEQGILEILPKSIIWKTPLADGGTGTVDSLLQVLGGEKAYLEVSDPLGRKTRAYYGLLSDGKTVVIEMASSTGLALLSHKERNPMLASSYGCGEIINHALGKNIKKIILGLGDTATVDGGIGLLQALGIRILDEKGKDIGQGAKALKQISRIDSTSLNNTAKRFSGVNFLIATDVNNPLLGKKGAAEVFAPQKGANKEMVLELEKGLSNWARVLSKDYSLDYNFAGSGAAGGVSIGLVSLLGAKIVSGSKLIFDFYKLEEKISCADLIFTGEGSIDKQTLQGKMPALLAKKAKEFKIPLIAFAGRVAIKEKNLKKKGFYCAVPIIDRVMTLSEAYQLSPELLKLATSRTLQMILLGKKIF